MSAVYSHRKFGSADMIFRDDVHVANINGGKVAMLPEHKKYGIQVGKFWKAFNGTPEKPTIAGNHIEQGVQVSPNDPSKPMVAQNLKVEPASLPVSNRGIPPCPPMDPAMGTKSPDVVAWYKRYQPEAWSKLHLKWRGR